jgi:hypothetical protein
VEKALVLATIMNYTVLPYGEKPPIIDLQPVLCERFRLVADVHHAPSDSFYTIYRTRVATSKRARMPPHLRKKRWHYVIAFRGTDLARWRNYVTNLLLFPWKCKVMAERCGWVHFGIQRAYLKFREQMFQLLPREQVHSISV